MLFEVSFQHTVAEDHLAFTRRLRCASTVKEAIRTPRPLLATVTSDAAAVAAAVAAAAVAAVAAVQASRWYPVRAGR